MKEKEKDHSQTDANSSDPVSDEVMSILADVEGQLESLHTAQQAQDKAINLLKQRSEALRKARDEFEKTKLEFTSQINDSGSEITALRERASELERLSAKERKEITEALKSAKEELVAAQDTAKEPTAEPKPTKGKRGESSKKLEAANKKIADLTRKVDEQATQLERGAMALNMVKQQQEQIDRLTKQLAGQKLRSDPYELQRRDERIAELTEALRQSGGKSVAENGHADLEQQNADLMEQVDRLRAKLEQAHESAEQAKRQLKEGHPQESTDREELMAEHAAKVAELTSEIDHWRAKAENQSNNSSWESEQEMKEKSGSVAAWKERVAELERELERERSRATPDGANLEEDGAGSLREKAQRVAAVAEHLRRRRSRLERMRHLMDHKLSHGEGAPTERAATEELMRLEQERMQLAGTRRALATAEKKMHRRWARHRTLVLLASIVLTMLGCALGAWILADHFFPALRSASVTLTAKGKSPRDVTPEQDDTWRAWHLHMINDKRFQQTLAKRMHERRMDEYADPELVAQKIRENLTIDGHHHGTMVLTLAGRDTRELTGFLDVVTATLMTESSRQMADRGDNLYAFADRLPDGASRYATVNDTPIKDNRMSYAIPIYGVLLGLSLVIAIYVLARLLRAKRVFDEDNAGLFADQQLNPMT